MWWQDAVVYQVYPRSFQDSDGDGVGDLRGIERRLDHLAWLGVDALWMSPIYPSPMADFGYDIADYTDVDPAYGSLADFDALVASAHERGIRVLMDLVPSHTSIEHPWFRDHPEWYIWSPVDGPPNNWIATFGGPAWSRDPHGRGWYLHSFYPEQPDLNWRVPGVRSAMTDVVRFWIDRGVDGFRVDAIDRLMKDAEMRDDPVAAEPFGLPLGEEFGTLAHVHSSNSPEIHEAIAVLRAAAGDAYLVGEVYLPSSGAAAYLANFDQVFVFELFHSSASSGALRAALAAADGLLRGDRSGAAWVLSNHDFPRLPSRFGASAVRVAALLLLTLPGSAFVYQGDEIGLGDGPGHDPPFDRAGRDGARHPMQWSADAATGGFTDGVPWLAPVDPVERSVEAQRSDPDSLLSLYRSLIAMRGSLGRGMALVEEAGEGVVAYTRGSSHVVVLNFSAEPQPAPPHGEVLLATSPDAEAGATLPPHSGRLARTA